MPSTPVKTERRKKLRKKPLRLVYVELAFGNGGMMRDLSEEGFAVRAMMPVKQGEKTPFSFTLGEQTRIEGEGKVLWTDEGGRVAGVQFTQIPGEVRSKIDDWLIEDEKVTDPREAVKQPKIAPAATIEELKEEIRSTPVRGEAAAPGFEEESRVEHRQVSEPSPVQAEPPAVPEPKVEEVPFAKPGIEPEIRIAAQEQIAASPAVHVEVPQEEHAKPTLELPKTAPAKVVSEQSAPPVSSVTEGFFRKWPKNLPDSSPVTETPEADLPPLPLPTSVATPRHTESRAFEEEKREDDTEGKPPLPDISDILIQPYGLSARAETAPSSAPEVSEAPQTERWEWFTLWKAVMTMVVLTVLVGLFVYHRAVGRGLIWLGEAMGGTSAADSGSGAVNDGANAPHVVHPENAARIPTVPSAGATNATPPLGGAPGNPSAAVTPLASPEASPDSGQSEYLQAMQLMRGRNAGNDSAETVRLLWIAVEKGNPSAEVALADLYWRGQGVVHNCDQARILFTTAARKGSSEAQKRLQQFQREGCE